MYACSHDMHILYGCVHTRGTTRVDPGIRIHLTLCGSSAVIYAPIALKYVLNVFVCLTLDGKNIH